MITGYYIRIKRNNSFKNLDISELTESELIDWILSLSSNEKTQWLKSLILYLKDLPDLENPINDYVKS